MNIEHPCVDGVRTDVRLFASICLNGSICEEPTKYGYQNHRITLGISLLTAKHIYHAFHCQFHFNLW